MLEVVVFDCQWCEHYRLAVFYFLVYKIIPLLKGTALSDETETSEWIFFNISTKTMIFIKINKAGMQSNTSITFQARLLSMTAFLKPLQSETVEGICYQILLCQHSQV